MNSKEAAQKILSGELVVFPTETVYGIGALASNDAAVRKIYEMKGRPALNPLILHIADMSQLSALVHSVTPDAGLLMREFWPGPLTICFRKSSAVSELVSAGLQTVCIRMPQHEIAREFLRDVGAAVAAPSANISGRPSTTSVSDAQRQLQELPIFYLDGGEAPRGLESTIVDCSTDQVRLLRPGFVHQSDLEKVLGKDVITSAPDQIMSPGQLLQHYAPTGKLTVIMGNKYARRAYLEHLQFRIGTVLGRIGDAEYGLHSFLLADRDEDLESYAARLYLFLNWCDESKASNIYLELPGLEHPLLAPIIDRLGKASRGNILQV